MSVQDFEPVPDGAVLIDVRTPAEFAAGHVAGALNIDINAPGFAQQVAQLPKDKTYALYCVIGARSELAKHVMQDLGFPHVVNAGRYDNLR